jgi:hypothetical protein
MSALNQQELHNLAMNIVGKDLESKGYEFLAINSELKKNPQFIARRINVDELIFVVVKAIVYPGDPEKFDNIWMESFKLHAKSKNAEVFYAGVGLANSKDMDKAVSKDDPYIVKYNGFKKV